MKTLEQSHIKKYHITGMTCKGCEAKVKKTIENIPQVESAEVSVEKGEGKLVFNELTSIAFLQKELSKIGNYTISEKRGSKEVFFEDVKDSIIRGEEIDLPKKSISTYKPLILIVGFILGTSILVQYPFEDFSQSFSIMLLMRHFMAGFFIVFAFFKLLNLEGFANSYQMYDIVAAKWKGWGYAYPFVELALGVAYLINLFPFYTNLITVVVLGVSSIGVIKSNLEKKKIKCACLGDVFNLPMSTVTIMEDVAMVLMAGVMLFLK